jgi:hypothetical protein
VRRGWKSGGISEAITKRHSVLIFLAAGLSGMAALPASAQTNGFVIGEGPGKLVDSLISAGYGGLSLYEAMVQIATETDPSISAITTTFITKLQSCPANSTIFTTQLSAYAGNGVVIYSD